MSLLKIFATRKFALSWENENLGPPERFENILFRDNETLIGVTDLDRGEVVPIIESDSNTLGY